jgi:hypothetical protein
MSIDFDESVPFKEMKSFMYQKKTPCTIKILDVFWGKMHEQDVPFVHVTAPGFDVFEFLLTDIQEYYQWRKDKMIPPQTDLSSLIGQSTDVNIVKKKTGQGYPLFLKDTKKDQRRGLCFKKIKDVSVPEQLDLS